MKGYGFCEYANRECGMKAKWALDGHKMYDGQLLACDWLDSTAITTSSLHSKLLYVDCLPQGNTFKTDYSSQVGFLRSTVRMWPTGPQQSTVARFQFQWIISNKCFGCLKYIWIWFVSIRFPRYEPVPQTLLHCCQPTLLSGKLTWNFVIP